LSRPAVSTDALACASDAKPEPTRQSLPGHAADLGGMAILRLLPRSQRRLVGPWCFLDAFGPIEFAAGKPLDVPPHPHIGLQTVTWLLEGEALHNDSLGRSATARPGVLNLMTAGRGIAHSEETPPESRGRLHGVQLWVALPDAHRHREPSFESHAGLPEVDLGRGRATVILGSLGGAASPGTTFSPIVGADVSLEAGAAVEVPVDPLQEHALVPLEGEARLDGSPLTAGGLDYLGTGRDVLRLSGASAGARVLLIGGAPFGETVLMWWNFVARTRDEIVAAREDWEAGRRFGTVDAYRGARTPAPPFGARLADAPSV